MQVSRTPIREALHKLALEGLLYSIPRAGYIVEEMSDYDIQDLFTTRMNIEQIAARLAMEKISEEELKQLALNIKKTDAVLESGLTEKMADLDMAFHGIIYKATRSKTLYQICQTLSDHTLKYRIALIHLPEIAQKTRDGHSKIYEAILSKEPSRWMRRFNRICSWPKATLRSCWNVNGMRTSFRKIRVARKKR